MKKNKVKITTKDPRNLDLSDDNLRMLLHNVIDCVTHEQGIHFPETDEEIERVMKEMPAVERPVRRHEVMDAESDEQVSANERGE